MLTGAGYESEIGTDAKGALSWMKLSANAGGFGKYDLSG